MTLLALRPEQLVDRYEPADLDVEIRPLAAIPADKLDLTDYGLRQWTLYALSRHNDPEGLHDLDDLVLTCLRKLPEGGAAGEYRIRWQAFRNLVESKGQALLGLASGRAVNLLHAGEILSNLQSGESSQSEMRSRLKLSAARMSQVLGVMEEGGLIVRQKRGKENWVSLSPAANSPGRYRGDGQNTQDRLGMKVFGLQAAA